MKIIQASAEIMYLNAKDGIEICKKLEQIGRICYKSEKYITKDSYIKFIQKLIKNNHLSIIEHHSITIKVICDRAISHEIVRHRIGSYSMESTRYVNYKDEMEFIEPCFWKEDKSKMEIWKVAMAEAEKRYQALIGLFATPEQARSILPHSLKTEIIITYNLREWLHFLDLRCSKFAHPQIREIALLILWEMKKQIPVIFDDLWAPNGLIEKREEISKKED